MATPNQNESRRTVLLIATRSTPVASRMAIRFARFGCRVSALYPSKSHPLASTQSVSSHHHYSTIAPIESLQSAMGESGVELAVPCDAIALRHLHALYGTLPGTPEGAAMARTIERSLGDPSAYLIIDSRHEIQTSARAEGLPAAESFAIGRVTDPQTLAQSLPFPWVVKADYSWGGRGSRIVHSLAEAREFIRLVGAPPSLVMAAKHLLVNSDRTALGEWVHAKRSGLSAQRPLTGSPANTVAACWKGSILALISVEILAPRGTSGPPTLGRVTVNEQMEKTVRRLADRLGLSGLHSFDFVLDAESGQATLTEFNSHCTGSSHLNFGPGQDLVDAFCRRWLDVPPAETAPVHPGSLVAYFPQAWAANPSDPILETGAYDVPVEDPNLVRRLMQQVQRDKRYLAFKSRLRSLLFLGGRR
jgi:hypothetical protein